MAGTVVADTLQAASTSTLVLKNGVADTPPTIQDSAGTEIGTFCRAWVNFNGTGTVAIRADFNVTDITDNGTGNYTVNFTNALPDTDYCVTTSGSNNTSAAERVVSPYAYTTSSVSISTNDNASALQDSEFVHVAIFR